MRVEFAVIEEDGRGQDIASTAQAAQEKKKALLVIVCHDVEDAMGVKDNVDDLERMKPIGPSILHIQAPEAKRERSLSVARGRIRR